MLYSSANKTLTPGPAKAWKGTDALGAYDGTELTWSAKGSPALVTQFKQYDGHIIFEQRVAAAIDNAGTGSKEGVGTAFPSFQAADTKSRRGALAYAGDMVGAGYQTFEWGASTTDVPDGVSGTSPLVIFAEDLQSTIVISPAYNFMAANQYWDSKHGEHPRGRRREGRRSGRGLRRHGGGSLRRCSG